MFGMSFVTDDTNRNPNFKDPVEYQNYFQFYTQILTLTETSNKFYWDGYYL